MVMAVVLKDRLIVTLLNVFLQGFSRVSKTKIRFKIVQTQEAGIAWLREERARHNPQ
jgi:hypothetical protein